MVATAKVLQSGLSRDVFPIGEHRATVLNQPSKEAKALPFYWDLPTNHLENIRWRIYARERALTDLDFRKDLVEMCRQDVAFFAETLVTIFEPRPPRPIPLKLWIDQVDVLAWAEECYGERDMGLEKSRGIGISWLFAIFLYHKWRFEPEALIGIMSKDETSLDSADSNSLLGKIVYIHERMPAWFRTDHNGRDIMKRSLTDHTLHNSLNFAAIQGFVPTDQKVRSLRFTCMFFDEFAFLTRNVQANMNSSVHTTPCRYFVSTWNGPDNEFHTIMRREKSTMLRVEMYWWNNSERYKGAYNTVDGRLKILDESYKYPPDYPFVLDGLMRSPWVDFELTRAGSSVQSALEELYGLQAESGRLLLRRSTIDLISTTVRIPDREGEVDPVRESYEFKDVRDGLVKVWGEIGEGKSGPFSAGCDLSFGRGATDSTLEVFDLSTGNQVLEAATNDMVPVVFAQFVYGVLQWLNGTKGDGHTYLTYENNGDQGNAFTNEIVRLGYGNVMKRRYVHRKSQDEPTYYGMRNRDGGLATLSELERAVLEGECTIRSEWLRHELAEFGRDDDGKPSYPKAEAGNGDRAQGAGLAWAQGRERLVELPAEKQQSARSEIQDYEEPSSGRSWSDNWSMNRTGAYGL